MQKFNVDYDASSGTSVVHTLSSSKSVLTTTVIGDHSESAQQLSAGFLPSFKALAWWGLCSVGDLAVTVTLFAPCVTFEI